MRSVLTLLCLALLSLSACTKAEVQESIGQGLKKSCQNNPRSCTVYDENATR